MSTVMELVDVTKYYGKTVGIDGLSLKIKKGEIFGFLGENGAGKTTTIRCILNIILPQSGEIYVNSVKVSRDRPEIRDQIGYLPGELNMPGNMKVIDFLTYISTLRNNPSNRLLEIANQFEVPIQKKVNQLSKGNKQKVGLILAFMTDPEILILDEPTAGLDPLNQQLVYDLILEEKKKGKTIFFSSHNLDEVQKICDRVGIIREGKLVSIEEVGELAEKISRKLTIFIDDLTEDDIKQISEKFTLDSYNLSLAKIVFEVQTPSQLTLILNELNQINSRIRDVSYPPASLEEYFLSKYRNE